MIAFMLSCLQGEKYGVSKKTPSREIEKAKVERKDYLERRETEKNENMG